MKEKKLTLFAVRDNSTGKFVKDLTNPSHKFWEKRGWCEQAIASYTEKYNYYKETSCLNNFKYNPDDLELVELTFKDYEKDTPESTWTIERVFNSGGRYDYAICVCSNCGLNKTFIVKDQHDSTYTPYFDRFCLNCGKRMKGEYNGN